MTPTEYNEARRTLNDQSRITAEAHREIWEPYEEELLVEGWDETTIVEIAELLGRTIEACRQRHHEIKIRQVREGHTKRAKSNSNSKWDRGWTSLEDMGF